MKYTYSHAPGLALWGALMAVMGAACLIVALTGGAPMPPQTYGSAMYLIPAWLWSLAVIAQGALLCLASARHSTSWVAMAGLAGAVIYLAIGVFSWQAEYGFVLSLGAAAWGVMHCGVAVAALIDLHLLRLRACILRMARQIDDII